jgi:hypothetical protein
MVVMFNVVGELQACMLLPSVLGELLTLKPANYSSKILLVGD